MRMALSHPARVNGIVALSSISRPPSQAVLDAFTQVYKIWTSTPVPSEEIMNLAIGGWGGDLDVNSDRCKIIKRDWQTRYNGEKNVEAIADCVNTRDDVTGKLKEIRCPVLLIQGEKDITWTVEEAEITKEGLPNAELNVIPGEGHMLIFARKADDVNRLIEGFLKKQGY
jgi:pimeloyl-ACP methyl ester carboxylesterase